MSFFNFFKSKPNKQEEPKVPVAAELTQEEIEAINSKLQEYNSFAAKEGKELYVAPKILEVLQAQALFQYALEVVVKSDDENLSGDEVAAMLDKAIKAQVKAYGLHDLPLYLFHLANIYEMAGNSEKAEFWFNKFVQLQKEEFLLPDELDKSTVAYLETCQGFSVSEALVMAKKKLAK